MTLIKSKKLAALSLAFLALTGCSSAPRENETEKRVRQAVEAKLSSNLRSLRLLGETEAELTLPAPGLDGAATYHLCLEGAPATCRDGFQLSTSRLVQKQDSGSSEYWNGFLLGLLFGDVTTGHIVGVINREQSKGLVLEKRSFVDESCKDAGCPPARKEEIARLKAFVQESLGPKPR